MGRKKKAVVPGGSGDGASKSRSSSGGTAPLFLVVAVAAGLGAWWLMRSGPEAPPADTGSAAVAPAPMAPVGSRATPPAAPAMQPAPDLPPLPRVAFPAARPVDLVLATYEFAARHPEVLDHVPCFCGCERDGHVSNTDCFVASRDAEGRVTWDAHGIGWAICIDVARDAMQMHASGVSVGNIRAAIDRKYGPHYPTRTPTPHPH